MATTSVSPSTTTQTQSATTSTQRGEAMITIESATVTFDKQLGHDVYSILYGLSSGATNQYQAIWGEVEPGQFVRWDVYSNGAYVGPDYLTYDERPTQTQH